MKFEKCCALFAENDLELTREDFEKLEQYAALLLAESQNQNVTAVKTEEEIWVRHFLDTAFLLRYLQSGSVIDLGTGGGIPAIPLAIMNPELQVTMLDSELHKIEFCRSAVKTLGLNAEAVCGRAEELGRGELRDRFDYVVSRAMASGTMLCEFGIPMLRRGGTLYAMKGRNYDPAAERFHEAAAALGAAVTAELSYELAHEEKHLIAVQKQQDTPPQYPRRFAKIKRSPL